MIRKALAIVMLSILVFSYAGAEEIMTPTFSFKLTQEWKVTAQNKEKHQIEITRTYSDGSENIVLFTSAKNSTSKGKTAKEMLPYALKIVKETNKLFKIYLENTHLPNFPAIQKVEEVSTSEAKVGTFTCILSSLVLVPVDHSITPITFMSLTALENGHRYNINVTTKAASVPAVKTLLEDAFKIIETYKTFQDGTTPV